MVKVDGNDYLATYDSNFCTDSQIEDIIETPTWLQKKNKKKTDTLKWWKIIMK